MADAHRANTGYPRKTIIERAIKAFEACGLEIGSVDISADGSIRISRVGAEPVGDNDEFEAWDAAGRL